MSDTLARIQELVARREVKISRHGYEELSNDDIYIRDIVDGIKEAFLVEDYPEFGKGPCVLVAAER